MYLVCFNYVFKCPEVFVSLLLLDEGAEYYLILVVEFWLEGVAVTHALLGVLASEELFDVAPHFGL
jgi:hypothetical protein